MIPRTHQQTCDYPDCGAAALYGTAYGWTCMEHLRQARDPDGWEKSR